MKWGTVGLLILSAAPAATSAVTRMLYPGFVSTQGAPEVGAFFVIAGWVGALGSWRSVSGSSGPFPEPG